jgi:hypothetical protein
MRKALEQILVDYPKDPVKKSAEDILTVLRGEKLVPTIPAAKADSIGKINPEGFLADEGKPLYLIMFLNDSVGSKLNMDGRIADFNARQYGLQSFDVESNLYDPKTQLLIVKQFVNREKATAYLTVFKTDAAINKDLPASAYEILLINPDNLKILRKKNARKAYSQYLKDISAATKPK